MKNTVVLLLIAAACATSRPLDVVQAYRIARERGDVAAEARYLVRDARMWYEERTGEGEPLRPGRSGRYAHWDEFFHSRSELRDWRVEGNAVSATVYEMNDFYRLLDWQPVPYRMTWWVNDRGRITGAMVQSGEGKATSRLQEFREWAKVHAPEELEYLMPGGKLDPTADRAERWMAILIHWRVDAGLPQADLERGS